VPEAGTVQRARPVGRVQGCAVKRKPIFTSVLSVEPYAYAGGGFTGADFAPSCQAERLHTPFDKQKWGRHAGRPAFFD